MGSLQSLSGPGSAVMTRPVSVAEISVNSRNPAAQLCVVSESSVSPESVPPAPSHSFYNRSVSVCVHLSRSKPPADPPVLSSNATSKEFQERRHGSLCDVIGLLTFAGRSERVRNKGETEMLMEVRYGPAMTEPGPSFFVGVLSYLKILGLFSKTYRNNK